MIYLYANWKSNKNITEARDWVRIFNSCLADKTKLSLQNGGINICIFPPASLLSTVYQSISDLPGMTLGSQDISQWGDGKHTGLINASSLVGIATTTLIGHAEMRAHGDSQESVERKFLEATKYDLTPILCIRNKDEMIKGAKYVAYEPDYAIGTGITASANEIQTMRNSLMGNGDIIFIYGGSVSNDNIKNLIDKKVCDGFLVGGASLDPASFAEMANIISQ